MHAKQTVLSTKQLFTKNKKLYVIKKVVGFKIKKKCDSTDRYQKKSCYSFFGQQK